MCFYHNTAKTTGVSIQNNLIYQTVGFVRAEAISTFHTKMRWISY